MQELNEYLTADIYNTRDYEHFNNKLDFFTKMLNTIGLKVKDHKNGGGGADNLFQVTDHNKDTFGLAIFVDRSKRGVKERTLSIKLKSSYIEEDIEMYKDKIIDFLQDNGIKYIDVVVQESTSYITWKPVKLPIIIIHMKNEFCPWNNK